MAEGITPDLAVGGRRWQPEHAPIRIGNGAGHHVPAPRDATHQAAEIIVRGSGWVVRPVGAGGGIYVNGRLVHEVTVDAPTSVHLGSPTSEPLYLSLVPTTALPGPTSHGSRAAPSAQLTPAPRLRGSLGRAAESPPVPHVPAVAAPPGHHVVTPSGAGAAATSGPKQIRIGRAPDNDLVVGDLLVSRHHAELRWDGYGWSLTDLGTINGTYVDGRRSLGTQELHFGQRLTFGNRSYVLEPAGPVPAETIGPEAAPSPASAPHYPPGERPGLAFTRGVDRPPALAAQGLGVEVNGGTRILDDVSFSVQPGELLAIVGPSGSGKSTLLKALTGSRQPEQGRVEVRGIGLYDAYDELSRSIGYVPQDDILHHQLTVRQALEFSAELRFPVDTTAADRARRVEEVMAELSLSHCADVPIEKVSGGQRKRTSVALELLTGPELLFLDEPTSGLDPGLERTVMELLRSLASAGRAVVVVTHSLQSLELCDRVLFLAPGGRVAFCGPPSEALRHFRQPDFIAVFRDLEAIPAPVAASAGTEGVTRPKGISGGAPHAPRAAPAAQAWRRQIEILSRRQLAIIRADRQNLAFLAGAVVVPGVLIVLLMGKDTLKLGQTDPVEARTILGAIVVAAVAIGTANAIREVVKEMPIYLRERAIGLQRSAYLVSKLLVIGTLTSIQVSALVLVSTLHAGGPNRANLLVVPVVELTFDVILTGISAVALGLLLSTLVSSSEKAMALVPVVFVVQWLLCGAGLDLQAKPVMREVGQLTAANWGMAASASSIDEHRLSQTCSDPPRYGPTYGEYDSPAVDAYGYLDVDAQERRADQRADREKEQARRDAAPTCDARWRSGLMAWLPSVIALVALTAAAMALADRSLARCEPLAAQRVNDWPVPWSRGPRLPF